MNIERMKFPRFLLYTLLKMQRKYGSVTGTIFWFGITWGISMVIGLTISAFIK